MIGKAVEETLHSGRSFEGPKFSQLSGCKLVQRRSFQLTDVNPWCSEAQQQSKHTRGAARFSPGSARVSRVGFGVPPKRTLVRYSNPSKFALARRHRQHARRARYPEPALPRTFARTVRLVD